MCIHKIILMFPVGVSIMDKKICHVIGAFLMFLLFCPTQGEDFDLLGLGNAQPAEDTVQQIHVVSFLI